jgi:hypothetical protein
MDSDSGTKSSTIGSPIHSLIGHGVVSHGCIHAIQGCCCCGEEGPHLCCNFIFICSPGEQRSPGLGTP